MNLTAHQEKKNEETKTGKRRVGEKKKRKQATDFEEAVRCLTVVVQAGALRKNKGECLGYLGPAGRPTAISPQPKRDRVRHHHVEAAVGWCRKDIPRIS